LPICVSETGAPQQRQVFSSVHPPQPVPGLLDLRGHWVFGAALGAKARVAVEVGSAVGTKRFHIDVSRDISMRLKTETRAPTRHGGFQRRIWFYS
jgi:hypothetical protein